VRSYAQLEAQTYVKEFPKQKIREAKKLQQENPKLWNTTALAKKFSVPLSVINAAVPRVPRRDRLVSFY
jgi:hypothetical protein